MSDMSKYCARKVRILESAFSPLRPLLSLHFLINLLAERFKKLLKRVIDASSKALQRLTYLNFVLLRRSRL